MQRGELVRGKRKGRKDRILHRRREGGENFKAGEKGSGEAEREPSGGRRKKKDKKCLQ